MRTTIRYWAASLAVAAATRAGAQSPQIPLPQPTTPGKQLIADPGSPTASKPVPVGKPLAAPPVPAPSAPPISGLPQIPAPPTPVQIPMPVPSTPPVLTTPIAVPVPAPQVAPVPKPAAPAVMPPTQPAVMPPAVAPKGTMPPVGNLPGMMPPTGTLPGMMPPGTMPPATLPGTIPQPMMPNAAPAETPPGATSTPVPGPGMPADGGLLPPLPTLSAPMSGGSFGGTPCNSCGSLGCEGTSCDLAMLPKGPKQPMFVSFGPSFWWFQPARNTFPLAIRTPAGSTIGGPRDTILFADQNELGKAIGLSIDGHMWMNKDHTIGVGLSGFITEQRSRFETVTGGPGEIIRRPFFDALNGIQNQPVPGQQPQLIFDSLTVSADGQPGTIATATTARIAGGDVTLRHNVNNTDTLRVDLFYGFRYYDLDESLSIFQSTNIGNTTTQITNRALMPGSSVNLMERVYTRNQFYGGELGGLFMFKHNLGYIAFTPKVAFGPTHQVTHLDAQTRGTLATGEPIMAPGALVVAGENRSSAGGNIGRFITNRFTVGAEVGTVVGIYLTERMTVTLGYQVLYLNNVARPGNQLDQAINPRVVPVNNSFGTLSGVRAPNVTFDREGFYAHAANVSMVLMY